MKKITAVLISVSMLLSFAATAFAETEYIAMNESSISDAGKNAAMALKGLGFLWEDYRAEAGFTRKELAEAVVRLSGWETAASTENAYFADVPKGHPQAKWIYSAIPGGCMDFVSGTSFFPDKKVTYYELLYASETILGYNALIDMSNWSEMYSCAVSAGLDKNVVFSQNSAVKSEYAAIVLYNALEAKRAVRKYYGDTEEYYISYEDTILSQNQITRGRGVVTANQYTSLGGGDEITDGIAIDGVHYTSKKDFSDLLGYYVEFYLQGAGSDKELLYAYNCRNKILTLSADELISSDTDSITYERNGSIRTVYLPSGLDVVYNNECIFDYTKDMLLPKNGMITLIDNNSDGRYDVAVTEEYVNYIANSIRTSDKSITDLNGKGTVVLDEAKTEHCIIEKNGAAVSFEDIKKYDVLSVYKSKDYIRAIISDRSVSTVISSADKENTLAADGKVYEYSDEIKSDDLKTGEDVTLLLDFKGVVAGVVKNSTGAYAKGVLMNIREDVFGIILTIFTEENTWVNFDIDGKIRLNGTRIDAQKLMNSAELYSDGKAGGMPVLYKLDAMGNIRDIETPKTSDNADDFRIIANKRSRRFTDNTNSFIPDSKYMDLFLDENTVVFMVPSDVKDRLDLDSYRVATVKNFVRNRTYTVEGFATSEKVPADIVMCYTNVRGEVDDRGAVSIVSKVYEGINSNGEAMDYAEVLTDGARVQIYSTNDMLKSLHCGDIIRYSRNSKGEVDYLERYFDAKNPPPMKQGTESSSALINITGDFCTVYGRCIATDGSFVTMSLEDNPSNVPKELTYPSLGARVYIFSKEKEDIRVGSTDDIEVGDILFIRTQNTIVKEIIIIT